MISLVIPTLRRHDGLQRCIDSFKDQYDELIVVDDTDSSLAAKINKGMRMSMGDFIVVCNDDVEASVGRLEGLCDDSTVLSPRIESGTLKTFHAHMFCIPRRIYAEVGQFDETCPGVYHIDSDYWIRLIDAGFSPELSPNVKVFHNHPASTINTLPEHERDGFKTRELFIKKHGSSRVGEVGA